MGTQLVTRRSFLTSTAVIGSSAAIGCRAHREPAPAIPAAAVDEGLRFRCAPARVFKAPDPGKEDLESWFLPLVLEAPTPGPWRCEELEVASWSGADLVGRTAHVGSGLAALRSDLPPSDRRPAYPFTLRIRGLAPRAARIDAIACALRVSGESAPTRSVETRIALAGEYEQRTTLRFPFRGRGLVTQGGAADGGHGNRSGQFAVDAIGLTPSYAPQLSEEEVNEAAAGFGREIVAPAAGFVVRVRTDRPDQPVPGKVDPELLLPEFRGGGDPGNHVVLDHENGEFSMIAHFQEGSLSLSSGQRVAAGEPIGLLGNSGDSTFPHVHYQLMDGADWMRCDALPYRFVEGPQRLVRGTFFDAKV